MDMCTCNLWFCFTNPPRDRLKDPEAHCGVNITQVNQKVQDVGGLPAVQCKEWAEMGKYVCHYGGPPVA